jgi:hypothetical protein
LTVSDFVGYAPVLQAIARLLAATENYAVLPKEFTGNTSIEALLAVVDQVLDREQEKFLGNFGQATGSLFASAIASRELYAPAEQRARLVAKVLKLSHVPLHPAVENIKQPMRQRYEETVGIFLEQHPFLDGTGNAFANAVFEADLICSMLLGSDRKTVDAAERAVRNPRSKPNPLLFYFYESRAQRSSDGQPVVPAEHVGALFDSLRAGMRQGVRLGLRFGHPQPDEDGEVEFSLSQAEPASAEWRRFYRAKNGTLYFVHGIADARILGECVVEIGNGSVVELEAPLWLDVQGLIFGGESVRVSVPPTAFRRHDNGSAGVLGQRDVVLISEQVEAGTIHLPPKVLEEVRLAVSWPNSDRYPWSEFSFEPIAGADPELDKARHALRRLVVSFRSHSRGELARYEGKIESRRMTKGEIGDLIRERLIADGILTKRDEFYFLDPDRLGKVVGTSYHDLFKKKFSRECDAYLRSILGR